jgi:uncharacterized membrane protein
MNGDSSEKREWLLLAAIVSIAALLRFYRIGYQSYWVDEILSLRASAVPQGVSFWEKILHNVHGPLHAVIIHLLGNISLSEGFLRAPSAIAGTMSVVLFYRWLVRLGRRDIALYGALFLALSPFSLYYSQELRYYSLMAMFCIITLILYGRYLEDPSYRRGAVLGLAATAASLSHFSALFLAAGLSVHLLVTGKMRGKHLRSGLLAALILLILISPWIYREIVFLRGIQVVQISELPADARLRGELTLNTWSYPYVLYAFSAGYSYGPSLRELHEVFSAIPLLGEYWLQLCLVGMLFGGLAIAGLWKSGRNSRLSLFLSVLLAAVILTTILAAFNIKVFNIRYMMAAFPVYLALITFGLPAARIPRLLVAAAVCALMLVSSWNYHSDPAYARDDIRSAVSVIREGELAGDMLLSINSTGVVEHYYDGRNPILELYPKRFGAEGTVERVERVLAEHDRVWYLRCRHWDTDPDDLLLLSLESSAPIADRWSFPGVDLFLFVAERNDTDE